MSTQRRGGRREQERLERLRELRELALRLAKDYQGGQVQEAALQMAAAQIFELLADFDASTLKEDLEGDVTRYTRLVNALTRLSEGGIKYEKYRAEVAERKARLEKEIAAAKQEGGLSPETLEKIERELKLF